MSNPTNVTLTMTDDLDDDKYVVRTIDISCVIDSSGYVGSMLSQKQQLENWISERGNEQHTTLLTLVDWRIS